MLRIKRQVATLIYGIIIFLVTASPASSDQNRKRTVADPVSNFFSELGDLFLDVDRAIAVQTEPKVQHEDRVVSQILRPLNRFQKNYRNIQTRLGNILGEALRPRSLLGDLERSAVGSTKDSESKAGVFTTAVPDTSRRQTVSPAAAKKDQSSKTEEPSSLTVRENECSMGPLSDPFLEHLRKQRCSRKERQAMEEQTRRAMEKLMEDTRRATELLLPLGSNALDRLSKDLVRRMGEIESEESKPEENIVGDAEFPESVYEKRLREFLKTHGRWLLDNPLLSQWRQSPETTAEESDMTTEYSTEESENKAMADAREASEKEVAKAAARTSTEKLSKSGKSFEDDPLPPQAAKYYTVTNKDGEVVGEEIDVVLEPQSDYYDSQDEEEEMEPQETVILAFTPDGVPLKLRMGPEIDNPIRYLHKVLKSAGVSLNIPVESYEDLEPVGKEVLRVGSGILMRAVYIDMSNNNELKSLLKTLMRSKATGKTKI